MIKKPIIPDANVFFILEDEKTGKCLIYDFLMNLEKDNKQEFKKIHRKIADFSKHGELPKNSKIFKCECGKIFALKSNQVRLYGFIDGKNEFVMTNARLKKRNKALQEDLNLSEEIRQQYVEEINERQ